MQRPLPVTKHGGGTPMCCGANPGKLTKHHASEGGADDGGG